MPIISASNISLSATDEQKSKFCTAWPAAKQGLELFASMIKNPIAKITIQTIIAAGDSLSQNLGR